MSAARLKLSVLGLVLLVGAAGFRLLLQHQSVVGLGRENQSLRQQAAQFARLADENERLSNLVVQMSGSQLDSNGLRGELLRLRGEVGRLRQQGKELDQLRAENRRFRTALATNVNSINGAAAEAGSPDYLPKDSWAFVGYATPEAGLQSGLWAANSGDLKTFLGSITGEMQAAVQDDLKDKTESEAAAKAKDEVGKITSCRILNREYRSADELVLTVSIQEAEKTDTAKLLMKKVANEWKLAGKGD
jgi:uncharacterized protein YdcH (DUF465 family)